MKKGLRVFLPLLLLILLLYGCGDTGVNNSESRREDRSFSSVTRQESQQAESGGKNDPSAAEAERQEGEIKVIPARVVRAVDGDTVYVDMEGKREKVRFIGVNTPETKDPRRGVEYYGREAAAFTAKTLTGREVYLEFDVEQRDKYGRLLAYIWLERPVDGSDREVRTKMFNARLLLDGYAQVMTVPPNVKYSDLFVRYQQEAREKKKGLWGP